VIRSSLSRWGEQLALVHRLESRHPAEETCGIAIEYFGDV
jgi:hypothetical protein